MGLTGAFSVLDGAGGGANMRVVGIVPHHSGFGGFAPCGDMTSAGPETATIAEDLPFERQPITLHWAVQASICQGDRCLSAVVGGACHGDP